MVIPEQWKALGVRWHLVETLNDGDTELIIYKFWRKHKQRWEYRVNPRWLVEREIAGS